MAKRARGLAPASDRARRVYTSDEQQATVSLILAGLSVEEAGERMNVDRETLNDWISLARDAGAPIPSNLDLRAMRMRRAKFDKMLEGALDFYEKELPKIEDMIVLAGTRVSNDLEKNRDPVMIGSQETQSVTNVRGTLVDPRQSFGVFQGLLEQRTKLLGEVLEWVEYADGRIAQLQHVDEIIDDADLEAIVETTEALPPGVADMEAKRNRLLGQAAGA